MTRIIYTDGACHQNGSWAGGFGVVEYDSTTNTIPYWYKYQHPAPTTNNRMELEAMLHALAYANNHPEDDFIIYSDSAYVVNSCNLWVHTWSKNGWKNSKKVTVENVDLMKNLYNYLNKNFPKSQEITIEKIKGHCGHLGNELCDALAADNAKKWRELITKNNITYTATCYCPICNKEVATEINVAAGHCPNCGHHLNFEDK